MRLVACALVVVGTAACGAGQLPPEMIGVTWRLDSIVTGAGAVTTVTFSPAPTAQFTPDAERPDGGRVHGFSGCNSYGGEYRLMDGARLTVQNLTSTLVACAPLPGGVDLIGPVETALYATLNGTVSYALDTHGLSLRSASGDTMWFH